MVIEIVAVVGKIISNYTGYRKDRLKEDDILVRKKLIEEIEKSNAHTKNIIDLLYEEGDKKSMAGIRKVKDELDVFSNDINLSIAGHRYPFFSVQKGRSPRESDLKKLIEFDAEILDKIANVTEATDQIEGKIIDKEELELSREFSKIRQYITKARNTYKDRDDFLRGWK